MEIVILDIDDSHRSPQSRGGLEYSLDQSLSSQVARMSLAAQDELERTDVVRDPLEPLRIGEHQIRAFVRAGPPRESDRHHRFVQVVSGTTLYFSQQFAFRMSMRLT